MNKDWHAKNSMPKNATMEQRLRWHKEHAPACGCRPIPKFARSDREERRRQSATASTAVITA